MKIFYFNRCHSDQNIDFEQLIDILIDSPDSSHTICKQSNSWSLGRYSSLNRDDNYILKITRLTSGKLFFAKDLLNKWVSKNIKKAKMHIINWISTSH